MSHPLEGVTRVINLTSTSTGAGNTYVDVRPDAGKVWEIGMLSAMQDDGPVLQMWTITDIDTTNQIVQSITGAANTYWYLGTTDDTMDAVQKAVAPLVVTYDRYLRFGFTASAAGKNATVRGWVKEFRGLPTEA